MKSEINILLKKFHQIKNQGYIKSIRKGSTGIGATFESLLKIPENNFEIPDYNAIEIKTKRHYSKAYTTLFNCTPEGPNLYEIKRIREKYGYPDAILKTAKVLNNSITTKEKTKIGVKYYFQLSINKKEQKVYLYVYDRYNNLLENKIYWTFTTLKDKLYRKVKTIAFVDAIRKNIKKEEYFKYYKMTIYTIKSFDDFIDLLENGVIRITFKISVFRDGLRKGKIHDHGTGFDIEEENLLQLYDIYQ